MNPIKALIDLIIPRVCHVCGEKLLDGEQFVCLSCQSALPRTHFHNYWQNTSGVNTDLNPMEERFAGQVPLGRATSLLFYTRGASAATLVHDFKYRSFPDLARWLGTLAARELTPTGFFNGIDAILYVPLHWRKHLKRGYNQTLQIAKGVSEITNIPVMDNLTAKKSHRTQTSLSREERIRNTKDIFDVKNAGKLDNLHLLLIDDICTSGATLISCAKAIEKACSKVRFSFLTIGIAGLA